MRAPRLPALAALLLLAPSAQAADAARGQVLYETRCIACHAIEEHGPGPKHAGVFGCRAGSQPGYDYSPALAGSGIVWDARTLDRWLANPNALVPGNKMAVRLADEQVDRADLIAWLEQASRSSRDCKPGGD